MSFKFRKGMKMADREPMIMELSPLLMRMRLLYRSPLLRLLWMKTTLSPKTEAK